MSDYARGYEQCRRDAIAMMYGIKRKGMYIQWPGEIGSALVLKEGDVTNGIAVLKPKEKK